MELFIMSLYLMASFAAFLGEGGFGSGNWCITRLDQGMEEKRPSTWDTLL